LRQVPLLCITAGGLAAALALDSFTLAWTHSIEKIRWEEDYQVEGQALRLSEARIRGSGAGMEPPQGAVLDARGVWHYVPALAPLSVLRITQSTYTSGYQFCHAGRCQALTELLPGLTDGVVELRACDQPG
jgi:hypothetical protein